MEFTNTASFFDAEERCNNKFHLMFPLSNKSYCFIAYVTLGKIHTGNAIHPTVNQFFLALGLSYTANRRVYKDLLEAGFIRLAHEKNDGRLKRIVPTERFAQFLADHLAEMKVLAEATLRIEHRKTIAE
jgi:DNA-binding MarR family transcriptional regulator